MAIRKSFLVFLAMATTQSYPCRKHEKLLFSRPYPSPNQAPSSFSAVATPKNIQPQFPWFRQHHHCPISYLFHVRASNRKPGASLGFQSGNRAFEKVVRGLSSSARIPRPRPFFFFYTANLWLQLPCSTVDLFSPGISNSEGAKLEFFFVSFDMEMRGAAQATSSTPLPAELWQLKPPKLCELSFQCEPCVPEN